jgi:hypothetical protein
MALPAGAAAQRLESSNSSVRATFPELTLGTGATEEEPKIICPLTLEGSFHSTVISKEPERLIGYVTRAIINEGRCRSSGVEGVTILPETLPWHIRYESFAGSLPAITRINQRVILASFRFRGAGVFCLYKSTVVSPVRGYVTLNSATPRQITSLTANEAAGLPRFEGSFICPVQGIFTGSGQVRVLGSSTNLIFIRLI